MLQLLTTDEFAEWFAALDESAAEDVATALDLVEQLGPFQAAPGSRESLLWYEHPSVSAFQDAGSVAWDFEDWGAFRDYAKRVLVQIESPRFAARLSRLDPRQTAVVFESLRQIKTAADPRARWTLKMSGPPGQPASSARPDGASAEVRRMYRTILAAAGFVPTDVPAHSLSLRELSRRLPAPGFRLLYGVDVQREIAVFVLGEWLDRSFYGNSVRRAEGLWKQFLEGHLGATEPAQLR